MTYSLTVKMKKFFVTEEKTFYRIGYWSSGHYYWDTLFCIFLSLFLKLSLSLRYMIFLLKYSKLN